MNDVMTFLRAFVRAMGDRDNHLVAYRQFAISVGVLAYLAAVIALAAQ